MKRTARRKKKDKEYDTTTDKTVGDIRNESKSKAQMKKDWGSSSSTTNKKLGK